MTEDKPLGIPSVGFIPRSEILAGYRTQPEECSNQAAYVTV